MTEKTTNSSNSNNSENIDSCKDSETKDKRSKPHSNLEIKQREVSFPKKKNTRKFYEKLFTWKPYIIFIFFILLIIALIYVFGDNEHVKRLSSSVNQAIGILNIVIIFTVVITIIEDKRKYKKNLDIVKSEKDEIKNNIVEMFLKEIGKNYCYLLDIQVGDEYKNCPVYASDYLTHKLIMMVDAFNTNVYKSYIDKLYLLSSEEVTAIMNSYVLLETINSYNFRKENTDIIKCDSDFERIAKRVDKNLDFVKKQIDRSIKSHEKAIRVLSKNPIFIDAEKTLEEFKSKKINTWDAAKEADGIDC